MAAFINNYLPSYTPIWIDLEGQYTTAFQAVTYCHDRR